MPKFLLQLASVVTSSQGFKLQLLTCYQSIHLKAPHLEATERCDGFIFELKFEKFEFQQVLSLVFNPNPPGDELSFWPSAIVSLRASARYALL